MRHNYSASTPDRGNQIGAKESVYGVHVNFDGGNWVRARGQADGVTSLQFEHPARVNGTAVVHCSLYWRLRQGNDIVVHKNMSSSIVVVVNLCVDVVPPSEGHGQFALLVLHTACKVAVWGTDRPVCNHWKAR